MFWQIYQKLMLRGFLSSGNLCLIHHLKLFWPHTSSTASNRKGAKIQHEFSWFCQKFYFAKHQNKVILALTLLNSRIWKTLKSSLVIFQALIQFFTNIWHSFWWRLLRPHEVKKVSNGGPGINFHYSGSHWASVFGRFVKRFGQARSLLYLNS